LECERRIIGKEDELHCVLQQTYTHTTIAVINETKKKLQGTNNTKKYSIIYSGVKI
jgi:hypothetical protein